ncbi:MAG: SpoIID/LytB domain-containing protein [Synergistaceae bacterium]|nr:SpoIID/LytB domain-containing protein [Synergistaceae bacterium]
MKKLPLFIVLIVSLFLPSESYSITKEISVLLERGALNGSISGSGVRLTDPYSKEMTLSGTYTVQKKSTGELSVGRHIFRTPLKAVSDRPIKYNGSAYYGSFIFKESAGGFNVSNIIDIEQYLRGVVKAEMSPKWPIEALKAQAVLARTFAVRAGSKHGEDDLCDGYHCQVYKGISAQDSRADKAIEETAGLILRWKGNPANVYYHSDSGGMQTSSKNVWGGDIPYLKPKAEAFAYFGPNSEWKSVLEMSFIRSKLEAKGITIGTINTITPLTRDESGRILMLEIKGSRGNKTLSGHDFRNLIGTDKIKSTLFEFGTRSAYININETRAQTYPSCASKPSYNGQDKASDQGKIDLAGIPEGKEEKVVWLTQKKVFTTLELMEILSRPDQIDSYIEKGLARAEGRLPLPAVPPQNVEEDMSEAPSAQDILYSPNLSMAPASGSRTTIYGRGSGHGVGMSQWGAKAMAEKGWTFTQILNYYFPGTTIGQ